MDYPVHVIDSFPYPHIHPSLLPYILLPSLPSTETTQQPHILKAKIINITTCVATEITITHALPVLFSFVLSPLLAPTDAGFAAGFSAVGCGVGTCGGVGSAAPVPVHVIVSLVC
eukprot:1098413_1